MNTYTKGTRIELSALFKDKEGDEFNPAVVRFRVRSPHVDSDHETVYTSVANPSTGLYYIEISANEEGRWRWRAEGEQPASTPWAANEKVFEVERSGFD